MISLGEYIYTISDLKRYYHTHDNKINEIIKKHKAFLIEEGTVAGGELPDGTKTRIAVFALITINGKNANVIRFAAQPQELGFYKDMPIITIPRVIKTRNGSIPIAWAKKTGMHPRDLSVGSRKKKK